MDNEMEPYQLRVVNEKKDLDRKIVLLNLFIKSEAYADLSDAEKERLGRQLDCMNGYSEVLNERIVAWFI